MLIGLRGSGKSTAGRRVAHDLTDAADAPLGFVDLDDRTPVLLDAPTAAEAINTHGLAAFRDAERRALDAVLTEARANPLVIALGGGTPTAPGAADLLNAARSAGVVRVVYLHAPPSVLRDRLAQTDTSSRPSLTGVGMLDEIETIYLQRDGLYRDLADRVIDTESLDENALAAALSALI